jgi:eukaryotic-like serine/threonine-protein kinase
VSVSIPVFWNLLRDSRLLAPEQVQQLAADFTHVKGAAEQGNAKTLGEWLVARNVLSKYQTTILLAGRAGPFYYGDYKVYDRVERGRLAGQFRAVHAPTGHPVLLQFLTGPVISNPDLWATAANEVLTASGIASPHVQRFFEPVDLQTFKFLVSEDLRGDSLDQRLAVGRFPAPEAARIVRLAAIGLAQMHQCGRAHGDVRPANVLLESIPNHPGNVKLLFDPAQTQGPIDFTQQQPDGKLSQMADYLAPELMSPGRVPDPLADIYALGCTLYAMLSGNPPFAGGNIQQKMARHAAEPIRPLEAYGVPQPLAQLVTYMMAKNPAVRYQSAAIVAEQIGAFIDPNVLYAQPPQPPATLAGFEQFVRQKHAALAAPKRPAGMPVVVSVGGAAGVSPSGAAAAGGEGATSHSGLPFKTDRDRFIGGDWTEPSGAARGSKIAGPTPEEIMRDREKQQRKMLIVGLVGAGVLAIGGLIAINMLPPSKPTPTDTKTVANVPEEIPEEPTIIERTDVPLPGTNGAGKTNGPKTLPPTTSGANTPDTPATTNPPPTTAVALHQEVLPDDGNLLWASPTTGVPISLRCVPPEAQVFLIVRPADMIASGEGERVLHALGPAFAKEREAWESASGLKLDEIEQLTIGLHNNDAKFPRASFVVKTKEAMSAEDLLAKWGNPAATKEGPSTYYTGAAWTYYISTAPEDERTFLMGEARDVKEVAKTRGAPPQLFRDMVRLQRTTDADRHVTLLFFPQFLFNDDGEPLFAAERAKVRQPLSWLLGDNLQAAAASLHFGEELYFEMRMLGSLDKEPYKLASELKDRLNQVPASLEDYFVSLTPPAYWKKLAFRYPGMIRDLHGNLRIGVESDQAVINSVLPGAAAHNLVLGGELLVATAPGAAAVAATAPEKKVPQTIEEALQLKTTYTFDSMSLEFAMAGLATDVKDLAKGAPFDFDIKLIGKDLEAGSITRNQSVRDFKEENKTVAEILTALCRKANPITTVKDPSEADQKLIWVVGSDPDNAGKSIILITTRAAAAANKYTLPAPFVPKSA